MLAITFLAFAAGAPAAADRTIPASTKAPGTTEPTAAPSHPLVVLWGDSLAWEAQAAFTATFGARPDAEVRTRTFGGTALCDWLGDMKATAATEPITAAVLEFSGNALTPCMQDPATGSALTGQAYLDAYAGDLERALAILEGADRGTRVYLVGAPVVRGETGDAPGAALRDLYRRAAATHGATYIPAGDAVLDHGRWTATLPCLPTEGAELGCTGGRIPVRAADGVHFCPTTERSAAGVVDACPTWSSGAFRFGTAMAEPVLADVVSASPR